MTSGAIDNGLGPVSHRFQSQRLNLHYLDWGNPDKPLLLLVHGGEDHARSWDWIARELRNEWHVVCPDARGHGDSDWSPDGVYTMEFLTVDIANLLAHLNAAEATFVGHSFGGAVSLRYAGLFPETVRRIAVIEGLASMEDHRTRLEMLSGSALKQWRDWVEKRRSFARNTARRYPTVEAATKRMLEQNPHLSVQQAHHLAYWGLRRFEAGDYGWKFDPYVRAQQPVDPTDPERQAILAAITCPVLLFHGAESWASNPAEDGRVDWFRDASVISLKGAGHWVHHDRKEAFLTALRDFL